MDIEDRHLRRGPKKYCAIVILDMENALYSENWNGLELLILIKITEYIRCM